MQSFCSAHNKPHFLYLLSIRLSGVLSLIQDLAKHLYEIIEKLLGVLSRAPSPPLITYLLNPRYLASPEYYLCF